MSSQRFGRRAFLSTVPAIASTSLGAAAPQEKLAVDGGKPVRATRLSSDYPGAQFYDDKELKELNEAYESRDLFRFYGFAKQPPKVAKLEEDFAAYVGAKHVLALTSGTSSIHTGLTAIGVGPGDEVILPAWGWRSCYTTIVMTGALPVFAEIDESFNLDPADAEKRITKHTKAIMCIHLTGVATDMDPIMALARKHNLKVIEDTAQSTGATYKGRRLGTFGDVGAFSFQARKMISAGEGGAICTNDQMVYERAIRFGDLGLVRAYHQGVLGALGGQRMPHFLGVNYRMSEMAGAVCIAQLRKLDSIIARFRRSNQFVKDGIQDLPGIKFRHSFDPAGDTGWVLGMIMRDKKTQQRFTAAMQAENVPMGSPSAATLMPMSDYIIAKDVPHPNWPTFNTPRGKEMQYGPGCCPRSMELMDRIVSMSLGPKYTQTDLQDIVTAIRKVYKAVVA